MVLAEINSVDYGSTGKIMLQTAEVARNNGIDAYCFVPHVRKQKNITNLIYFGHIFSRSVAKKVAQYILCGRAAFLDTYDLIRKLKKINPDVIHLHNLHNETVNLPMLFNYIKKNNIRTVWTLHDCWAFTGHCPYFTLAKCDRWKSGCFSCPQYSEYPASKIDNSKSMWRLKKKWFDGIKDMTVVTPSRWLAGLVKDSFLGKYPIKVINNGIDLSVFKPVQSDFKARYGIENKYIILGVAMGWDKRKGLDVFIELSKQLDEKYQIVLVGTSEEISKKLPENIISINSTHNQRELAEIYTAADVFANPTREENYPTVNMEALACGTPVVTFNTGGSPEIISKNNGTVVENTDEMKLAIENIVTGRQGFSVEKCLEEARGFNKSDRFSEYLKLYKMV